MLVDTVSGDGFILKIFQFGEKFHVIAYDSDTEQKIEWMPIRICPSLDSAKTWAEAQQ